MRTITLDDIATIVSHIVKLNNTPNAMPDDIDHLGSRRVRFIGEILQQKMRVGLTQMKRNIQDKMSTIDTDATLPTNFISPRPLQARLKEFFATNQLSQFMQQENILTEMEHLRTLSALSLEVSQEKGLVLKFVMFTHHTMEDYVPFIHRKDQTLV